MTSSSEVEQPIEKEVISVDRSLYETIVDGDALDRWIAEARHKGYVAIDTETDCIDCVVAKLVGVSLATEPNKACYIPIAHGGGDLLSETPRQIPGGCGHGEIEAAARGRERAQDRS